MSSDLICNAKCIDVEFEMNQVPVGMIYMIFTVVIYKTHL